MTAEPRVASASSRRVPARTGCGATVPHGESFTPGDRGTLHVEIDGTPVMNPAAASVLARIVRVLRERQIYGAA
jgi:hypothetical protein